jgi:phosphoribosylanthranilate isomerase
MRVKICGITRRDDALCALDAGADMLGFIFVPSSKRCISPDAVADIIRSVPNDILTVGVFVNAPRTLILDAIRRSGVKAVQLHGEESPSETEGLPVRVLKAHRVGPGFDPAGLGRFHVDAHVLDTFVAGAQGGTGQVFDWNIARAAAGHGAVILGGGLSPANVADAIAQARPMGVDVSSGVEATPGIKDHEKVRTFVRAALNALAMNRSRDAQGR